MHLPEIDKYAHLDSPLHRWDPRAKVVCLGALLLVTVFAPTYPTAAAALAVSLGLVALTRIPPAFVFVHTKWVLMFCGFLLVVMGLTGGGEDLARWGPVGLSRPGLRRAGLISIRALAAVLLIYPIMGTARFHVTLKALQRLGVPNVAVQILAFSYRYAFVLFDELRRMLRAARARGLARTRGLRAFENFGNMIGMLFVRSFQRTERVRDAMLSRGYSGKVRTLGEFRLRAADLAKAAAVGCFTAGLLAAEVAA